MQRLAHSPFATVSNLNGTRRPHDRSTHLKVETRQVQPPSTQAAGEEAAGGRDDTLLTLRERLLSGASSLLGARGMATCAVCKGSGACPCAACKGRGVVAPERTAVNQLRMTANRLKSALGVEDKSLQQQQWLISNRCRRCHGSGGLPCPVCQGKGVRARG